MRGLCLGLWMSFSFLVAGSTRAAETNPLDWLRDERAAFTQAQAQKRFVLLYLEAVWCHWCHVMDHDTYGDPKVRELLAEHYVILKIDQDLRPDLANRYRDYGWPATVVFAADGTEIVKRRGFIPPERFARLLTAIVNDPSPEELAQADAADSQANNGSLAADTREQLLKRHQQTFDPEYGGLKSDLKNMDRDQVEYAMWRAARADEQETLIARKSLDGALNLIDPAWGGVYQYSTGGNWSHLHFEKLSRLQGEYLRIYALACAQFSVPAYCRGAGELQRYLRDFLTAPDGSFYTAQDADLRPGEHSEEYFALDDAGRRKLGIPKVDTHVYARENGFNIEGLAALHEATGDPEALVSATRAAENMLAQRALPGGGFRHDAQDAAGPFLADTLSMGRAFLQLYRSTGERRWLQHASAAADFIGAQFKASSGFLTAVQGDAPIAPVPHLDEVLSATRFFNLLARYNGNAAHKALAAHGLAYMVQPAVALSRSTDAGILLADEEFAGEPVHLTIRGGKDDPQARLLFDAALRIPGWYKRLDWWDEAEGPLPNPDVSYPKLKRAAAFFCTANTCSVPLTRPEQLAEFLAESKKAD